MTGAGMDDVAVTTTVHEEGEANALRFCTSLDRQLVRSVLYLAQLQGMYSMELRHCYGTEDLGNYCYCACAHS